MITIKDKLNRASVLIKRTNEVDADYVTTTQFDTDIKQLNKQITTLNTVLDNSTTIDDFNTTIEYLNYDIDNILAKVERLEDLGGVGGDSESYDRGYVKGVNDQKNKLSVISITKNGNYTSQDGYRDVYVNVPTFQYDDSSIDGGFDFTVIGYNESFNNVLNNQTNADIAYSKTLYDAWDPSTSGKSYFRNDTKMVYAPNIDTSNLTSTHSMFEKCPLLTTVPTLDLKNVADATYMFYKCYSLRNISLINTSKVKSVERMFMLCSSLEITPNIDTSAVETTEGMFESCVSLQSCVDYDFSNASTVKDMFNSCSSLVVGPNMNTSKATDFEGLFYNCVSLETVGNIDTSNAKNVYKMFAWCENLKSLPKFNFSNVRNINSFFSTPNSPSFENLTDLGGFEGLQIDWNDGNGLNKLKNLSYQSILNVIDGLYDFGPDYTGAKKELKISRETYSLLTAEDINRANAKGWEITK